MLDISHPKIRSGLHRVMTEILLDMQHDKKVRQFKVTSDATINPPELREREAVRFEVLTDSKGQITRQVFELRALMFFPDSNGELAE